MILALHHATSLNRISAGPVATLRLPHNLPASLHGSFSSEFLGPEPGDSSVPQWREAARYRAL